MPRSTPHLCSRCNSVITGRCPTCSTGWATRAPDSWKAGGTRRWRRVRAQKLSLDPLCEWPGCHRLATTVDHIDGTDYDTQRYDMAVLRSLCDEHHAGRTAAQGNAARRRG